jgi:hypothetical protein
MKTLPICLLFAATAAVYGGPLQEARVQRIINEVQIVDPTRGTRAAVLEDVIKDAVSVKTGIKSRSELRFQDNTLTRLGPETFFSFTAGTRDLALKEGSMLLQVPKGLGGAKIRTAAVTAAITGTTIMLEHRRGRHIKVLVLEGSLRLSANGRFGDSVLLTPGKMVIMPPNAKRIPEPVSVDLAHVMKTSALVKMSGSKGNSLPSLALIEAEIERQTRQMGSRDLVATDLVVGGRTGRGFVSTDDVLNTINITTAATATAAGNTATRAVTGDTPAAAADTPAATAAAIVANDHSLAGSNPPNPASNGNGPVNSNGNGLFNGGGNGNVVTGNGNGNHSANGNGQGRGNGGPAPVGPRGR